MKRCCKNCWIDKCSLACDAINAEDSLCLINETFEELFKWYDKRSAGWKKRANPKLWAEVRRQWKICAK